MSYKDSVVSPSYLNLIAQQIVDKPTTFDKQTIFMHAFTS